MSSFSKSYAARLACFIVSVLIVAAPLELLRPEIGEIAYVATAFVILAGFYWLGIRIARRLELPRRGSS